MYCIYDTVMSWLNFLVQDGAFIEIGAQEYSYLVSLGWTYLSVATY